MKIYISGAITALPREEAEKNFKAVELLLKARGLEPCNPMTIHPHNPEWNWKRYLIEDIRLLLDCSGIIMQPNWMISQGAKLEHHIAKELGLTVEYIQDGD